MMRQYIWTAIIVVTVGVNASDNPFELNENFKAIEQEQDSLLKELKAISEAQEALEDAEDDAEDEAAAEERATPEKPVKQVTHEATKVSTPAEKTSEVVEIDKMKEAQAQRDAAEAKALAQKAEQERAALKKLEEERAARKRAQEAELKRLQEEKARLEAKVLAQKNEQTKEHKAPEASKSVTSGVDINITKEEEEAKRKADELLKKAMEEVDQED